MLVCSNACKGVEEQLRDAGYWTLHFSGGRAAIQRVKHELFDMAVVISTGDSVDSVETVLNLREIRPAMPIVVIAEKDNRDWRGADQAVMSQTLGKTTVVSSGEFTSFLAEVQA
jgi:DNA-binding response OmpR family regulator